MEEIEKRVEELRKFVNKNLIDGKIDIGLMLQDMENLIKRNKELEEEKKRQSIAIIEYQDLLENSIPKSKLKEKIEELKEFQDRYEKCNNLKM